MQVERTCFKCGAKYYIDQKDRYDLCHDCYLQLDKEFHQYKEDFYKTHDKGSEPVCFDEFYDNEFQQLFT